MAEYYKKPIDIVAIENLSSRGLNWRQIAGALSISEDTLKRRRTADPEIELAYNRGLSHTIAAVANAVVERALEGCPQSQKLFLNSIAGWAKRTEIETKGGYTPTLRIMMPLPDGTSVDYEQFDSWRQSRLIEKE